MNKAIITAMGILMGTSQSLAADRLDWNTIPLPGLNGGSLSGALFKDKVVLVVNTASKCGFTPQYQGLQKLWVDYRDKGLVVLGVPSNDFGGQEPGTSRDVASFCEINYGVTFPLLDKQHVTGKEAHPLYQWANEQAGTLGAPRWNFHKYLIGRDGRFLDWFASTTSPDSDKLKDALDAALKG